MTLTTYFSMKGETREYVQCTHGLFEPTMDPAPLLDEKGSGDYLPVPRERKLSERILKILDTDPPEEREAKRIKISVETFYAVKQNSDLVESAIRIKELSEISQRFFTNLTAYNWGDVANNEPSYYGPLEYRKFALCTQDIGYYHQLSSERHRVSMIFRGHQHKFRHLTTEGKVLVTTLPVGMDCGEFKDMYNQDDRAYILQLQPKVQDWTKRAILRKSGHNVTDKITDSFPVTSSEI